MFERWRKRERDREGLKKIDRQNQCVKKEQREGESETKERRREWEREDETKILNKKRRK